MSAATDQQNNTSRTVRKSVRRRRDHEAVRRLVRRATEGDQRAWDDLVEEFAGLVWSVARRYRLSDADAAEVSQVTWMRLVEHLHRLRDPSRVAAWLATTAGHESVRLLHGASRVIPRGDDMPEHASDAPGPGETLLADERDRALWSALARLPERDRTLLRMLMSDSPASYAEISATLGMPIGSIGPTRARALERLRAEVRRQCIDSDW